MRILQYNPKQQRLWICGQRIHHGPIGILLCILIFLDGRVQRPERFALAFLIALWGLSDLPDRKVWFLRGPQL